MCLLAAINPSADALGYIQVVPSELYKNEAVQISFVKSQMGNVIIPGYLFTWKHFTISAGVTNLISFSENISYYQSPFLINAKNLTISELSCPNH